MSIYNLAAKFGVPVGIVLTMMSACFIFSGNYPFLSTIQLLLLLVIPAMLYIKMRRVAATYPHFRKMAALWVFGIYSIIFGTLICALATAAYLLFLDPGFIERYLRETIASIESTPLASTYAPQLEIMKEAIRRRLLPSPMEFVVSMSWATSFFGSMLSLPLAFFTSRRTVRTMGSTITQNQ